MSQAVKAKTAKKNAGTQTREIDTVLEIARLQEQVKLLTIENEHLRKYTIGNPLTVLKSTPIINPNNIDDVLQNNETQQRSSQSQSVQRKSTKVTVRGCSCKGKCCTKICGCVKKDTQCGEWCNCNNGICQNQEHKDINQDKENLKHNELIFKHVENQQIINKYVANVNVQKGLFSPDTVIQDSSFNVNQFRPSTLYFGSPRKLTFVSDEEEKQEENKKLKKKTMENNKNDQNGVTQRKSRAKKNNLKVNNSEYVRKLRSTSNEEKRMQNDINIEKHSLRKCGSSEIQMDKEFQNKKQTNNYIQNTMHGMVLPIGQKKFKNEVKETVTANDTDSKQETGLASVKRIPENVTNEILKSFTHEKMDSHKLGSCDKNTSYNINKDNDSDFDPMKPKRELPRTPVHDNSRIISDNISNTSLPMPVITTTEEEPAELSQPQVNWEEHQSQLVACGKCKRRFHPFRIKKHVSCCKRV